MEKFQLKWQKYSSFKQMCFLERFGDFKINIAIGSSIGKNVVLSTFARVKKWPLVMLQPIQQCLHFDVRTDYGHTKAKSQILCGLNSNPNTK